MNFKSKIMGALFVMEPPPKISGGSTEVDPETEAPLQQLDGTAKPVPAATVPSGPIVEGKPFEEVYRAAGVAPMAYTAERMLTILAGLKAMPPNMAKMAVEAMDQADDTWSIPEVVEDARAKQTALSGELQSLQTSVRAGEATALAGVQSQDTYHEEATRAIREQIAELEGQLQAVAAEVADEKAKIHTGLDALKSASLRETQRVSQEMNRLGEVIQFLGSATTQATK